MLMPMPVLHAASPQILRLLWLFLIQLLVLAHLSLECRSSIYIPPFPVPRSSSLLHQLRRSIDASCTQPWIAILAITAMIIIAVEMAAAGLVALFRGCMESLKSILTSQEFGTEYELLSTELSLQCLRFRLWGISVGMSEDSNNLPTTIINRQDIQPTFDQAVGSIKYLLDEVEDLRRRYHLVQLNPPEDKLDSKVKTARSSKSLGNFSSLRSTLTLRQRVRDNQKQKSFLVLAKWAICDARRFHDKVEKLKSLIDGLEDTTKAAGLANSNGTTHSRVDDNPPPYSAAEPPQPPLSIQVERVHQPPAPRSTVPINATPPERSLSLFLEYHRTLERFLSVWPDESRSPRPEGRSRMFVLTRVQFQELAQDVYDELLRRQRYDAQTPQWLPENPLFYPQRNETRRRLSTIAHFRHLVSDVVFEVERRLRNFEECDGLPFNPNFPIPITPSYSQNSRRWGVCYPPSLLQYRAAHQPTYTDLNSLASINRASVAISTFNKHPAISFSRNQESSQDSETNNPDTWQCSEGRHWPIDRVLSWLVIHDFSSEWQKTFKALNIFGSMFLELGNSNGGRGDFGITYLQIYPRLAMECVSSGKDWNQSIERKEGKRLRRLVRRIPFQRGEVQTPTPSNPITTRTDASVEIFKSFRVHMDDPCYKVLPAALRKYNISAPWEQYGLYIVYGDKERCLGMEEKPLILFKQLDKEGKKPMFMLRKIAAGSAPTSDRDAIGRAI